MAVVVSKRQKRAHFAVELEPDWDPPEHERQYFRSAQTGDRGWMVRRGGKDTIKLDRKAEVIERTFFPGDWVEESPDVPDFTAIQIAQVTFEADKALCRQMGDAKKAKREWLNLSDDQRIQWMNEGPVEPRRKKLYAAVKKALQG